MTRLFRRLQYHPTEPESFSSLVQVFRFRGLLGESVSAHKRAVELDPGMTTSVAHTHFLTGKYETAIDITTRKISDGQPEKGQSQKNAGVSGRGVASRARTASALLHCGALVDNRTSRRGALPTRTLDWRGIQRLSRIRWREVTTGHTRRVKQEDSSSHRLAMVLGPPGLEPSILAERVGL
jgi:hypothetical protein